MRKAWKASGPVSFAPSTITSLRPGQKWQLNAMNGTPPYTFSIQSGSGFVSASGAYTAPTSISGTTSVKVTDSAGSSALVSIANAVSSVSMISGTFQIVADPQFILYDSGGSSANYGNAESSMLLIRSDQNSTPINLVFDSFQTESGYDILKIYNGDTTTSTQLGNLSGNSIPSPISGSSKAMLFGFSSDSGVVGTGYQAHWSILPANPSLLHVNKYMTDLGADENFVATGGTGPYTFAVNSGLGSISTSATDPATGIYTPGATPGDVTVQVTDSTGSTYNESFSVGAVNKLCTQTSSSSLRGVLYDNGGPSGSYANSSSCGFLISNSGVGTVELKFDYVQTEAGFDLIKVYDGMNASGTLLATYSGNFPATATLTAASGSMYILFATDPNTNTSGFRATWKILP